MRGHPRFGFRTLGMMVRLSHHLYRLRFNGSPTQKEDFAGILLENNFPLNYFNWQSITLNR